MISASAISKLIAADETFKLKRYAPRVEPDKGGFAVKEQTILDGGKRVVVRYIVHRSCPPNVFQGVRQFYLNSIAVILDEAGYEWEMDEKNGRVIVAEKA